MTKKLLNQKEQWYADTLAEAKEIVNEAQEKGDLASQKITGKSNKFGSYHLVDLTYSHETPRGLMEEREEGVPEGQLTIDEVHEGVEVTVGNDGSVSVKTDEVDDLSDIEFKEIPDEKVTEDNIPF